MLIQLPARKVYGVLSRHLGTKTLFINLSITIPIELEAGNSRGVAGAPYGEHGPLQDRAGAELCSHLISVLSTRLQLLEQTGADLIGKGGM